MPVPLPATRTLKVFVNMRVMRLPCGWAGSYANRVPSADWAPVTAKTRLLRLSHTAQSGGLSAGSGFASAPCTSSAHFLVTGSHSHTPRVDAIVACIQAIGPGPSDPPDAGHP